jgi:DNA mismatch endonuclease (patch repair protein)
MDRISREHRSWNMSRIKSRDTNPERTVRSILHRLGYRFRLHVSSLPGRPDIVLPKWRQVILVHGCFWHRHKGCTFAYTPKSRIRFWLKKFEDNVKRDAICASRLRRAGWHVAVVWECQTVDAGRLGARLQRLIHARR